MATLSLGCNQDAVHYLHGYKARPRICLVWHKGEHESIHRSPGSVPVSHLDYFGLTQICGNTCAQVPEPMGQVPVMIQVPMSMQQKYSHQGNCIVETKRGSPEEAETPGGGWLGFCTGIPRVGIFNTVPVPANTIPVFAQCLTKPAVY